MKKIIGLSIASLFVVLSLVGCGQKTAVALSTTTAATQSQNEQAQAAQVVTNLIKAEGITYKNTSTYGDMAKYMTQTLTTRGAANTAKMDDMTTQHKVVVTMSNIKVSFVKKDGDTFTFEGKCDESDYSDELGKVFRTTSYDAFYTVSKQSNGTFLVSDINSASKK